MKIDSRGQAILILILVLGMIISFVVIFGAKRQEDLSVLLDKLENGQVAQEIMAGAAKRVQVIYSAESGCDPDVLDQRLSRLSSVDSLATSYGAGFSFAVAQPTVTADLNARANRCTSPSGCRQLAVPLENRVYIATIGRVATEEKETTATCADGTPRPQQCPRDATVRISTAIEGTVYFQRFSLINICTYTSCGCVESTNTDNFTGFLAEATGSFVTQTLPCTGLNSNVPARFHGSIVSSTPSDINADDIRWGRRFLETGGSTVGETTYMYVTSPILSTDGNGTCAPLNSAGQCIKNCIPAFDLNRDRVNNEVDLAILESFMRGLIPSLSPNRLDPTQ